MSVYSASLGVECSHCHEAGIWAATTKPAHAMVAKMLPIFDEIPKHFDETGRPITQCYMCHQGTPDPGTVNHASRHFGNSIDNGSHVFGSPTMPRLSLTISSRDGVSRISTTSLPRAPFS